MFSKGYMLGYFDMRSKNIHFLHRFLGRIGDNMMRMAINRIDFK